MFCETFSKPLKIILHLNSTSSQSWALACVYIMKGRRTHLSLFKHQVNQKKRIYRYVNPSPEWPRSQSWVTAFVFIVKWGRTHLSDPMVGQSEQKHLPLHKSFTGISELSIMNNYICVDLKWGKNSPLTDQSVVESESKNLSVRPVVHSIIVLQILKLIERTKYSRGGSKCGYSPNRPLLLCTFNKHVGRDKTYVNTWWEKQ